MAISEDASHPTRRSGSDGHQRVYGYVAEALLAVQEAELDHEGAGDGPSADAAHELERGFGRAAGREQVVDEQHALIGLTCVEMDLEPVGAVLELVALGRGLPGQLAGL